MDLYRIDSALFSERTHCNLTGTCNDLSKQFGNSDILSSSDWSSVIHQPAQDSEPEDLPSTVDIAAIKEPSTPVNNASAQTPAGQLHGDTNSFELSDDQNVNESDSDSDSESDSGNSENEAENVASGADSVSCSDSDSVSSRRSSSSSKEKPQSSHSSRSASPPSTCEDQPSYVPKEKQNNTVCDKDSDSESSSSSNNASPAKMCSTLVQEKRGPGRPKKSTPSKVNDGTKFEEIVANKIENHLEKLNDFSRKLIPVSHHKVKSKKLKYTPVVMCLENSKLRKKKPVVTGKGSKFMNMKINSAFVPLYSTRREWLHKHKKRKKKESRKKYVTEEFIKLMEELTEIFNKKCSIADRKNIESNNQHFLHSVIKMKLSQRMKERNNRKRKHSEKSKHSDNDSELETNSAHSVVANISNTKRRHEKSTVKAPKIFETNSDQRLPLKKRHYQISASSITINNHQAHTDVKNRIDKHSQSASGELSTPASLIVDPTLKINLKSSNVLKNNQKSKSNTHVKNRADKHSQSASAELSTITTSVIVDSNSKIDSKSNNLHKNNQKSKSNAQKNVSKLESSIKNIVKTETPDIIAKKNRICKDMSICLEKLSSTELSNNASPSSNNAADIKPKLKRRKSRNRTGFPIKKKKKKMKVNSNTTISSNDSSIFKNEPNLYETIDKKLTIEKDDGDIENYPLHKIEIEIKDENISIPESRFNRLPTEIDPLIVLPAIENVTIKVKNEVISEDEVTEQKHNRIVENKPDLKLLPTRCSARINIKNRTREKEEKKKSKKKLEIVDREKKINDKKLKLKNTNCEKEIRSKEETDKDELSDADSIKCKHLNKVVVPKWKKKYLVAGLFSEFYKEEKHATIDQKNRNAFKSEDHPLGLLPPPPYFDDWVRGRSVGFKLPYDLWWLHNHNQLPGREVVQSWNYKKIRTNVYYDVKPTYMYEAQACNCEIPVDKNKLGCGEDCINRLVYAECSPQLCPLKQRCSNQKIQKHEWASKFVKFMTTDKGWGVKTEGSIKNGEFILEYVGEVVSDKEFKKRMTSLYKSDIHHYCLNLDGGLLIDGHRMGGTGRFVNHSCEPNCEMQKWSVNGLFRMALFALRDIKAGEELTYDYNFALFNPAEGQPCKCGSTKCRGVIGGKSQRVCIGNGNNTVSSSDVSSSNNNNNSNTNIAVSNSVSDKKCQARLRPRKQTRKSSIAITSEIAPHQPRRDSVTSTNSIGVSHRNVYNLIPVKQLMPKEKLIVQTFRVFLLRNLTKVQRIKEKIYQLYNNKENSNTLNQNSNNTNKGKDKESQVFLIQLNALSTQRFIKTRRLAQAEDNPEMTKTAQLANIFRTMYTDVVSAKDEKGEPFSSLFMTLPPKKKLPMYYMRIGDPIDLTIIEKNILNGVYKAVEMFDKDMNKLISNNVKFYGRTSECGIAAIRLRKEYNIAKLNYASQIKEIVGEVLPPAFMPEQEDPGDEDEDVIRCICGLYNDEGLMIQCERCLVWQHSDCVRVDVNIERYLCERCSPRVVDYEISLDGEPDYAIPGEKHYLTLMREDLQIRQGDTVYVLRDIKNPETGIRYTFKTIKNFRFEDCDIFRIERLYKDRNGERMSFGHHYLRPHETFHEPTRKFYPNEVVKVPLYETVPLDLIMRQCYVLDTNTYCKGCPIDSDPQHVYICEFRVDKSARLFFKIPKSKQPAVCTKNYAFEKYDVRLKPARTYAPHGEIKTSTTTPVVAISKTTNIQKRQLLKTEECVSNSVENVRTANHENVADDSSNNIKMDDDDLPLAHMRESEVDKKKRRLNYIMLKLLAKNSSKTPLDASYLLLDLGRRIRRKPGHITPAS